jgi:hypothetical protein
MTPASSTAPSIDGLDFYAVRAAQKSAKNATRNTKELFVAAGRAAEIPESERGAATALLAAIRLAPPSATVRTLGDWKSIINEHKADNRDLKLALSLAGVPWTISNEQRKLDSTAPQQSPEGTWYCIIRKTELTPTARAVYNRKMTCVHTPRRNTAEEALADRAALLVCDDVQKCISLLNGGRTAFDGRLGNNLRLEDGRFAARWDSAEGERRVWFDVKEEAEAAARALNSEELSPTEKDVLAEKLAEESTTAVVVHGGPVEKHSVLVVLNACRKTGPGATTRVCSELNRVAENSGVRILWLDVREECCCPPGFCLPLMSKNGDTPEKMDKRLDELLEQESAAPLVIMNRGVAHILKNRHLSALQERPYWALAFQPCNYNQEKIGKAMEKFLVDTGIKVTQEELREWSSEPSEFQANKRFKGASASTDDKPKVFAVMPKYCTTEGCTARPRDQSGKCKAHGGGVRCSAPGCSTAAVEGGPPFCRIHRGGRRCAEQGCPTAAAGSTDQKYNAFGSEGQSACSAALQGSAGFRQHPENINKKRRTWPHRVIAHVIGLQSPGSQHAVEWVKVHEHRDQTREQFGQVPLPFSCTPWLGSSALTRCTSSWQFSRMKTQRKQLATILLRPTRSTARLWRTTLTPCSLWRQRHSLRGRTPWFFSHWLGG